MICKTINNRKLTSQSPADNGRFGKIAALAPQQRQCKFASASPARTLVKPLPRQAAGTLHASGQRQCDWKAKKTERC